MENTPKLRIARRSIPVGKIALNIGQLPGVPQNPRFIRDERFEALKKSLTDDPEMLSFRELIVVPHRDGDGDEVFVVIGGNMRFRACRELGYEELPCVVLPEDTPAEKLRAYLIKDNAAFGELDYEILANEFDLSELRDFGLDFDENELFRTKAPDNEGLTLVDRYIVPPFSILDGRMGYWQERKRAWKSLFDSTAGRGKNLLGFSLVDIALKQGVPTYSGTSEFDPVLCEVLIRWFTGRGASILDPFSGGCVRGVVSSFLDRSYVGVDIRPEQIEENKEQWEKLTSKKGIYEQPLSAPLWLTGDSAELDAVLSESGRGDEMFDFVLSCPPYGDLEVYSDMEGDLSNMEHEKFLEVYGKIIEASCRKLKNDSFAAFVVADFRDGDGNLRNFVSLTIDAFQKGGLKLYNEAILVSTVASAALRAQKIFNGARKVTKCHQNVLVFLKGDARRAAAKCEQIRVEEASENAAAFKEEEEETLQ